MINNARRGLLASFGVLEQAPPPPPPAPGMPNAYFSFLASSGVTTSNEKIVSANVGNGLTALQNADYLRPALTTVNGVPVARFNNSSLQIPGLIMKEYTIFSVFKATANGFIYEHSPDSNIINGCYLYSDTGSTMSVRRTESSGGNVGHDYIGSWGIGGSKKIVCHRFNVINDEVRHQLFINNNKVLDIHLTNTSVLNAQTFEANNVLFIGNRDESGLFITMDLAHLEAYPALTDAQVDTKYNELATQYNAF